MLKIKYPYRGRASPLPNEARTAVSDGCKPVKRRAGSSAYKVPQKELDKLGKMRYTFKVRLNKFTESGRDGYSLPHVASENSKG